MYVEILSKKKITEIAKEIVMKETEYLKEEIDNLRRRLQQAEERIKIGEQYG